MNKVNTSDIANKYPLESVAEKIAFYKNYTNGLIKSTKVNSLLATVLSHILESNNFYDLINKLNHVVITNKDQYIKSLLKNNLINVIKDS